MRNTPSHRMVVGPITNLISETHYSYEMDLTMNLISETHYSRER